MAAHYVKLLPAPLWKILTGAHLTSSPPAFSQNAEAAAFSCQLPAAFSCQFSRQLPTKKRKFVIYCKFSFFRKRERK
jgi:hypothetical protein